jgi:hypothetical protein
VPLAARVRSQAFHIRREVRRVLRILTSWPGTAHGTVSSRDAHQRAAAEALQLQQDKQDMQCVVVVGAGLCRYLRRAVLDRDQDRGRDVN